MKKQLVILLLAILSPTIYANTYHTGTQSILNNISSRDLNHFKGRVTDSKGNGIGFATVALVDTSGVVIAGTAAGTDGDYCLRTTVQLDSPDRADLICSFVGYKEFRAPLTSCIENEAADTVAIRTIVLEEDSAVLATAVVTGKRELLEQHFDKIVMNVSELAVAQTGDAMDVLRNSPGVTVDKDGNVKLNGQTVAVWIDGRPSNLSGKDLENFLKGSPGNSIDKVELMVSPSAKYDAEGSGGIINIKTRKGFKQGFSGSVTASGAYDFLYRKPNFRQGGEANLGTKLIYKTDKTYTLFSYTPGYIDNSGLTNEYKWYGSDYSLCQNSFTDIRNQTMSHDVKIQNDWHISDKDIFGVIANFRYNGEDQKILDSSTIDDYINWGTEAQRLNSRMRSGTNTFNNGNFFYANLNYSHIFDEARQAELTINIDYSRNYSGVDNTQKNVWLQIPADILSDKYKDYGFFENTDRTLNLVSVKSDYSTVFWEQTGRIEAGFKFAASLTDNEFSRYNFEDTGSWTLAGTPEEINNFKYREYIGALYCNIAKQFGTKFNAQIGVRGEVTATQGLWQNSTSKDGYFNIFPNATLSWMPSRKFILSANYAYRISRPKYWQLNPFRSYLNATTSIQGKADLKPAFSHNVSLSAVIANRFSIFSGYSRIRDYSDIQVPVLDNETGMMLMKYENSGVQQFAYLGASVSELPITKWWTLTANASYNFLYFKPYDGMSSTVSDGFTNTGHSFNCYATTTFYLPKNYKTGLSAFVVTPQLVGYYKVNMMWKMDWFLSKSLLDGNLSINLYVNDLFNSFNTNLDIIDNGRKTYTLEQYVSMTSIKLGVSWNFGKSAANRHRNVGELDEQSRF
ncbi:MAG: outer membrane beta-barrel protein [Candidatus Cryptobacteroides sp.]